MASPLRITLKYSQRMLALVMAIHVMAMVALVLLAFRPVFGVQAGWLGLIIALPLLIRSCYKQVRALLNAYQLLQIDSQFGLALSAARDRVRFPDIGQVRVRADSVAQALIIILYWDGEEAAVNSQALLPDMMSAEDWRGLQVCLRGLRRQ